MRVEHRTADISGAGINEDGQFDEADRIGYCLEYLEDRGFQARSNIEVPSTTNARCPNKRVHRIVDEEIVPGLHAVPVDNRTFPVQHEACEDGDDARLSKRVLTRPENVGETQGNEIDTVRCFVETEVIFDCLLRDSVGSSGALDIPLSAGSFTCSP